ncbi:MULTISPECIES: DUF6286 domain-containing protein [unclassified Arthrobacter]|uniref:DUF6286 domain-containing protein n=1 Tax=unclassified Arthrobacter TaxID=235627 RepID=UPI001491E62D|nr:MULTISPECIES: DUF6286 domain-containing protein [unclassified Arthrobacter]MBE0009679.1 hypothetical protein [Arthrobacter sp. AET 35A]NOJ63629.1 hypothetical protein [Arthrobacter sp. 147(2020)]
MSETLHTRRLLRRETHSSRAVASVSAAVVLLAGLAWLGTEAVLSVVNQPPLIISPPALLNWAAGLPSTVLPWGLTLAGLGLALVGLMFLLVALTPGTRDLHVVDRDRTAVVVDSEVIAAAVSRRTRQEAGLDPDQVSTRVDRRRITVDVRPTSGSPLDETLIRAAVEDELSGYGIRPEPGARINLRHEGALGI